MSARVYGIHAARAVLQARPGDVTRGWLLAGEANNRLAQLQALAAERGITLQALPRAKLDELASGGRHQGIVLDARPAELQTEAALKDRLAFLEEPALLLVLDQVQDPHNLGACLRSADAFGVHGIIIPQRDAVGLNPTVRKVACGAAETVPVIQAKNLARCLAWLGDAGVQRMGLAGEAAQTLAQVDLSGSLALVLGAEGEGLRRLTRERCDSLMRIPMLGTVESLNVSVATGICLHQAAVARR